MKCFVNSSFRTLLLLFQVISMCTALNFFTNFLNSFSSNRINPQTKKLATCYKLIVEYGMRGPDNFLQQVILINGTFPGPLLTVSQHEDLVVEVVNRLDHGITMHFHGLLQRKNFESDGSPGIVQCPILPNCSYVYRMRTEDQVGTFMYHAHIGLDQGWAHGALIIKDDPLIWSGYPAAYFYHYDKDKVIFLGQAFHLSLSKLLHTLVQGPFQGIPDTESLLINGKSYGVWNETNGDQSTAGYEVINVDPGFIYRFRVINMAIENMLQFKIQNHTMTIVEIDGTLCNPVETDELQVNSGQRYSVLVEINRPVDNYLIQTRFMGDPNEPRGPRNGIAILHYQGARDPEYLRTIARPGKQENIRPSQWVLPQLFPNLEIGQPGIYPIPKKIDRSILISSNVVLSMSDTNELVPRFEINGNIAKSEVPEVPYLHLVREKINITKEPEVFEIWEGQSIQFVFQNHMLPFGYCLQHPWHFHGHSIYVVGEGPDLYDPERDDAIIEKNIQTGNLRFRDVVTLIPDQVTPNTTAGAPCGWIAIRFCANNPGLWLVHCHVPAHAVIGKRFILWEHSNSNPTLVF